MGCSIVAGILISVIGGLLLDQVTGQTPLFTLIGVALGMFLAGYQLWELAQLSSRSGKVGPVARRVVRVQLAGKDRKSRQK